MIDSLEQVDTELVGFEWLGSVSVGDIVGAGVELMLGVASATVSGVGQEFGVDSDLVFVERPNSS